MKDSIQQRLTDYAFSLGYEELPPEVIHAAKVRVIDTLGVLIGGFFGESCGIARSVAAQMPDAGGATVIGTRMKTTPDMAAFVNAVTSYYLPMTDGYLWPGSANGHPSNLLTPVLAVAEHARSSGREFIAGLVLAYEVYMRFSDVFHNRGFDTANFACIGTAVAAGRLLGLTREQLAHCIAMAVVPNVVLKQANMGHRTMFFAARAGQAGRAGVFAASLARAGMEGPHLPFEGKAGWCEHVARERFSLDTWGGSGTRFKILDTFIKDRLCVADGTAAAMAAEKVAPVSDIREIRQVRIETYSYARTAHSNPEFPGSRETAFHCIPYLVAVTLLDGMVTQDSYDEAHLSNPALRALLTKTEVVENEEFTRAYDGRPPRRCARVTVTTSSGEHLVGEAGGGRDDLLAPKSDAQIVEKFRTLSEGFLGAKRVDALLDRLWHLEELKDVAAIPPDFVFV